jgi:hypothetical protein
MSARHRPLTLEQRSDNNSRVNERDRRPSEDIEHKAARRQLRGTAAFNRRLRKGMFFLCLCGFLCLLYSWTTSGEAARLHWQKEDQWHQSWYIIDVVV